MKGDTSENRRGGGLRKEDKKAYRTIFFFSVGVDDMEESDGLLLRDCTVIYMKPGGLAQI